MTDEKQLRVHDLMRNHSWGYFQVHAQQRLTTFNFYLILSSVLTTALLGSFQQATERYLVPVAVGLLLAVFSFLFSRLDVRNKQLKKNAEAALRSLESHWMEQWTDHGFLEKVAVFTRDESTVVQAQRKNVFLSFFDQHWSYSRCFNLAFLALGLLGAGTAVLSLVLYFRVG